MAQRKLGSVKATDVVILNPVSLTADISGNIPVTNIASGTGASGTTFLRGDMTWSTPAGSGTVNSGTAKQEQRFQVLQRQTLAYW